MNNSKLKLKTIILGVLLILSLALIAAFGYFTIKSARRAARFKLAVEAFNNGKRREARRRLIFCIMEDRNNEQAFVKLAELMEQEGSWSQAAVLWGNAAGLNHLQKDYLKRKVMAEFMSRDYRAAMGSLEILKDENGSLTPHEKILEAFAWIHRDKPDSAEIILKDFRESPAVTADPLYSLVKILIGEKVGVDDRTAARLKTIAASEDPIAAFDARLILARFCANRNEPKAEEEHLLKATEINREKGSLLLGDFYYRRSDFKNAAKYYKEGLDRWLVPAAAARLGESYAALNQLDELKKLSKRFQRGNKEIIQTGYYLDALAAYLEKDYRHLALSLRSMNRAYDSPPALMIQLYSALAEKDVDSAAASLRQIGGTNNPDLFRQAHAMALPLMLRLAQENHLEDAAKLALIFNQYGRNDLVTVRLTVLDKYRRSILSEADITAALALFPDDAVLLDIASAHALRKQKSADALRYTERLIRKNQTLPSMVLHFAALESNSRTAEASALLLSLMEKNPQNAHLAKMYLIFAVRHSSVPYLNRLLQQLKSGNSTFAVFLIPLTEAEIRMAEGNSRAAARIIEPLLKEHSGIFRADDPDDVLLLYRAGFILASADRNGEAVRVYTSIRDRYPDRKLLLANLSEVLAVAGDREKALECARQAYETDPSWKPAQECYGVRLYESGRYKEAAGLLESLLRASENSLPRSFAAWKGSLENLMKSSFSGARYAECAQWASSLLTADPGNRNAASFLAEANKKLKAGK